MNNANLNEDNHQNIEIKSSCERCKKNKSTLLCEECKPFHFFCNQCDTSVHQLPSRKNHHRFTIDSFQNFTNNQKTNEKTIQKVTKNIFYTPKNIPQNSYVYNNENINENDNININKNLQKCFNETLCQKTPKPPLSDNSYTYIYSTNGTVVGIGADECKKVYSKDYLNEIKIMHDKEKEELIYKITLLENSMNRIKSSFNDQISKIKFTQVTTEKECNNKIEIIKTEYNAKINNIEKEKELKDKEISNLNKLILKEKKTNEDISSSFEELKDNYNNLINEHKILNKEYNILEKQLNQSKQDFEDLNQKYIELQKDFDRFKEQADVDIQNIVNENEKNISNLIQQKELEIKELNLNHKDNLKNELDKLTLTLTDKYEKIINQISDENNIIRQDNSLLVEKINYIEDKNNQDNEIYEKNLNELKNDIEEKNKNINELKKKLDEMTYSNNESLNIISDLNSQNDELKQIIQEKIKEITNLEDKILLLNNELNKIQSTNDIMCDKINKLQDENRKIKVDFDSVNIECNNKLKNFKFIEERNAWLENENDQLKNKVDKYIKPLSFNYIYAQK